MHKYTVIFTLLVGLLVPAELPANQSVQQLGVCLSDSLNGKERKLLARWIFFAMSSHSTINPYLNATEADIEASNQFVGNLITQLMTVDCTAQAKVMLAENNATKGFEQAFRFVGEVAMQELMTEPRVTEALGAFEQYMDIKKIEQVFEE